jgi:tetratricopeptide (TPR) repeat protein
MTTTSETFQLALAHHNNGRLREAETLYRGIIADDPRHAQAFCMLGILAHQAHRPELAVEFFRQAIAIDPARALFHNGLGEVFRSCGQLEDAKQCFQQALRLDVELAVAHYNVGMICQMQADPVGAVAAFREVLRLEPNQAETHHQLGNLFRQQGNHDEALRHFRQAINGRGDFAEAHNDLGNLLQDMGQLPEAIANFEQALRLRPEMAEAYYNLGNAVRVAGDDRRALAMYRQAIRLEPDLALAHNNLGTVLKALGDTDAAVCSLAEAVRLQPRLAEAQYNLATLLQLRGDLDVAKAGYLRTIELDPGYAPARYNLGTVWQAQNYWDEARACYLEALRIRPRYAEPLCNLGLMCLGVGQDTEALAYFDRALEVQPDFAEARCARGMLLLGQGNYQAGWPEFAWHARCASFGGRQFDLPAWDGSPLEGRTILIHCGQGLGDALQFVRYLPSVRARGAGRILLAAQVALHPLLRLSGVGDLVAPDAPSLEFATQAAIMNLPGLFQATAETVPAEVPYLQADPDLVQQWHEKLARLDGFKIGIGWQGNRRYPWDHLRSIPLAEFEPLARTPGTRLISLQQGEGREQIQSVADWFEVVDLGDQVDRRAGAFVDTAAILKNLDLVITSDTALAHLAGALAVPVWLALPFAPDWRWLRQGQSTAWYPTMRLYRQARLGDWSAIFAGMAAELPALVAKSRSPAKSSRRRH